MKSKLANQTVIPVVRMCIAMGWPAEKPEEEDPQPVTEVVKGRTYGGLIHGDMHDQNSELISLSWLAEINYSLEFSNVWGFYTQ